MSEHDDKLMDHEYDGIRELDNDLPRWWRYLFYFTIVWGVLYFLYYHVLGIGYLQADEYQQEFNANYIRVADSRGGPFGVYNSPMFGPRDATPRSVVLSGPMEEIVMATRESDTTEYVALTDEVSLFAGQEIYTRNCLQCHGALGEGGIGPNMTDAYWLHGNSMNDMAMSIKYGYPAKGMIAWRGFLKKEQIVQVTSFILTMQGTNAPNGKAPQGELVTD